MAGVWLAGIGMGLNFFSGMQRDKQQRAMVEAQYKRDLQAWEFQWEEAQDQYTYQVEDVDIAEYNLAQTRAHRNQTELNAWIDRDKQRLFDYNNQVQAYNASVENYGEQLAFNDIAAELTSNAAKRVYNDNLTKLGFELEDISKIQKRKDRDVFLKRKGVKARRGTAKKDARTNKQKFEQALKDKQAEYNSKLDQSRIKSLEDIGTQRALGRTGASVNKGLAAQLGAIGRFEADILRAADSAAVNTRLDLKAINDKLEATGQQLDLENEMLMEDLYNTRVDSELGMRQLNEQLKSTNLEYEAGVQRQLLDKYQADITARGRLAAAPILAPQLSKPLELPEPVLLKPRHPRKGPKPIKGVANTGHGLAALGSGLASMGSAIAGASSGGSSGAPKGTTNL